MDLSGLPTERIIHELPGAEQVCPECGGLLHPCGQEVLRRELVYIPAQYKVREHIQTVYSCRQCEKTGQNTPMKKSGVPKAMMNSLASDYGKTMAKYGADKPEIWAELANDWLNDADAKDGKATIYFRDIVQH